MTDSNFLHNALFAYGVDDIGGYSSLYPKRYGEYLHLSQNGSESPPPDVFNRWTFFNRFGSPLLNLLNTKYLLLSPGTEIHAPGLKRVYQGEIAIYENEKVFQRAFFVPGHLVVRDRKEAYQALGRFTDEDFRSRVILEQSPPFPPAAPAPPGTPNSAVDILSHKPDRVEIRVSSGERGFLVLSDNYDPGWKAEVDGRSAEVFRANYIMRAVPLEAGDHHVILSFRPALQIAGLVVDFAGWVTLCTCIVISLFTRRTR